MTSIADVFTVEYGNKLDMNKLTKRSKSDGIAFVGRKGGLAGHSGISGYVAPVKGARVYPPGALTVALGGSRLLSTYVQQREFYTAQNVAVLFPKDEAMSLQTRLYYAMAIRHNAFRYTAFGREANRTLRTIGLPSEIPAWVSVASVPTVAGLRRALSESVALGNAHDWGRFRLDDLFEIRKGRRLTKAERMPGETRYIGATEFNNGVTDLCDVAPNSPAHTLTVAYNGSVGSTFYQDQPYFACDDVNVLVPRSTVTKWGLLFAAAAIKHERHRFTYGYKWTLARMKETTIRLPVDSTGKPDWRYAESMMRGLPFSAAIKEIGSPGLA
jgi:hypothetical protein